MRVYNDWKSFPSDAAFAVGFTLGLFIGAALTCIILHSVK